MTTDLLPQVEQIPGESRRAGNHQAESAQTELFPESSLDPPPARFEEPGVRVFVTDLAEQALKLLKVLIPLD